MYCHAGQRSKCKECKLHVSEVFEQPQAAPGCVHRAALLGQESSHCQEVGFISSGGPRFWLPVFWSFTITAPCFGLRCTEFEVVSFSTASSVHTCSYKKTMTLHENVNF